MCVATAPGVFAHNEHRQSTVLDAEGGPAARVLEAAANCPVSAIRVTDAGTGRTLFPPEPGATRLTGG